MQGADITASLPADKTSALLGESTRLLRLATRGGVATRPRVREYAGRNSHAAGIVPPIRPFLDGLWAVLANPGPSSSLPCGLVRPARAASSLRWLCAFYSLALGPLARTFAAPAAGPPQWIIAVDASPWGIGGTLTGPSGVVSWFSDDISPADCQVLRAKAGVSDHMTLWELLALLVALRGWSAAAGA